MNVCGSNVALGLNGPAIRKPRNPSRRATVNHGSTYDPWGSWQVLNLQCYSDWNASLDVRDSSKQYLNGPEAFLVTVLGELRNALKRFSSAYKEIKKLVTPPLDLNVRRHDPRSIAFRRQKLHVLTGGYLGVTDLRAHERHHPRHHRRM